MGGAGSLGTLFIRLTANATDLIKGMDQAETKIDRSTGVMGKKLAGFGLAATGVLTGIGVAAVREFAIFESSFAGVKKTIDATEMEYKQMAETFREMARVMPTNVNEINRVAEAAGSLGIEKNNLKEFTKVMIDMGNTTNLTSDAAATEMARFANITRMSQKDFARMGSTIVDLGNKLATTEAEIMSMGLRLAGAGKQVGMTEPQILALAAALSSVGVEAEAGGTAMSQMMIKMSQAVAQGSEELTFFARTAGMTRDEFQKSFGDDAANTILQFLNGVNMLNESGQDVFTTLEKMGIQGVRLVDVTTRAAGAQKLFNEALGIGEEAWEKNTALTVEAEKRYETLESQLQVTINLVRDIAISIGEGLAPAIRDLNKDLQDLMQTGNGMNETWKEFGSTLGTTLNVLIKGAVMIGTGMMNAFKIVAIALSDGTAMILEFVDLVVKAAREPGKAFEKMVNVIIDGINWLIERVPDSFWKLIGVDGRTMQNFIPSFDVKFESPESVFKGWAEGFRQHANDMGAALERQFIPTAELKRTMDEVVADMEKQATYSEKELEMLKASTAEADKLAAAKERGLEAAQEQQRLDSMMKRFEGMQSADQVRGPATFGFGFGNSDLQGAVGMQQELLNSEADMMFLEAMAAERENLTADHLATIEDMWSAHNEKVAKLRQAQYELAIQSSEAMFGDLASIAEAFAGKQSGIYKAMFAASKAFAIAESVIKIQQGVAAAAAMPWPVNLAAIASVVAATANIVSTIQSVKLEFGGARAAGGPVVPSKSFLVGERGSEMFVPSTSGTIVPHDELVGGGGGNVKVIINNFTDARAEVTERMDGNEKIIEIAVKRSKDELTSEVREGRGNFNRAMQDSYGLGRKGK